MAPSTKTHRLTPSMLPADVVRKLRGIMSEDELLRRCRDAARREMRGSMFSPEDRADCAAVLMVAVLESTAAEDAAAEAPVYACSLAGQWLYRVGQRSPVGTPPARTDRRYSLTVLCGKARNYRASLQAQRDRDDAERVAQEDRGAWSMARTVEDAEPIPPAPSIVQAWRSAVEVAARLEVPSAELYLYRLARNSAGEKMTQADLARTIGATRNAIKKAEARTEAELLARYPSAAELLRRVSGTEARPYMDKGEGLAWQYGYTDGSAEAKTGHGSTWGGKAWRDRHAEWRTGTAGGSYPERPADAAAAVLACDRVRHDARYKPRPRPSAADALQADADARRRLGVALQVAR